MQNFNYYPKKSFIHQWDPRLKLISFLILMVVSFLKIKFSGLIILSAIFWIIFLLARLPIYFLIKPWWKFLILFIVIVLINSFIFPIKLPEIIDVQGRFHLLKFGHEKDLFSITSFSLNELDFLTKWNFNEQKSWLESVLRRERITSQLLEQANDLRMGLIFRYHQIAFSYQTFFKAWYLIWKIYLIMNWSLLLIRTTKIEWLLCAWQDILKPLKYLGINVNKLATALMLVLNAIPIMTRELNINAKAQACRGSDLKASWWQKLKTLKSLIIPMFNQTFLRADIIGTTMYARGYHTKQPRTRHMQYLIGFWDLFFLIIIILLIAFLIIYCFFLPTFMQLIPLKNPSFIWDQYL